MVARKVALTRAFAPVLATIALLGAVAIWSPGAAADPPDVTLSSAQARAGDTITVSGTGWPWGNEVTVSVCADPGDGRARDCAPQSQVVVVSWDGHFTTDLTVVTPEAGCPCVIAVDGPSGRQLTSELTLVEGEATPAAPNGLRVEGARLVGGHGLATWFGAAASPDLELTLHNGGTSPAELSVDVRWRDGQEDPVAAPAPSVPALEPGQTRTVVVPLVFADWSQGSHTVEGSVSTAGAAELPFEARMTVVPWGLYALIVVALAAAAGWRNRWLFAPHASDRHGEEDLEEVAIRLIEGHAAPRVPRQGGEPEPEPERESWVPMDPAEMIERSTIAVPRQRSSRSSPGSRSAPGSRAARSNRVAGLRRR